MPEFLEQTHKAQGREVGGGARSAGDGAAGAAPGAMGAVCRSQCSKRPKGCFHRLRKSRVSLL